MDWLDLYENFTDLPEKEQYRLFEAMKETQRFKGYWEISEKRSSQAV